MKSETTRSFRKLFSQLSPDVRRAAQAAYKRWKENPHHPSLEFKQVHAAEPVFSVRVSLGWRAIGVRKGETMIWFWIGSHNDYDKLLNQL